jgi:hypothetical protein
MKNQEYTFDTWGNDDVKCEAIAIYNVWGGCPGDDMTPPDPPTIEIVDVIYRIDRDRMPPLDIPSNDYHYESLDLESIEDSIYNEIFPHS